MTVIRHEPEPQPQPKATYTLTLTEQEAVFLRVADSLCPLINSNFLYGTAGNITVLDVQCFMSELDSALDAAGVPY